MTFTTKRQPNHDRAQAGRKGKANSPWRRTTTKYHTEREQNRKPNPPKDPH